MAKEPVSVNVEDQIKSLTTEITRLKDDVAALVKVAESLNKSYNAHIANLHVPKKQTKR